MALVFGAFAGLAGTELPPFGGRPDLYDATRARAALDRLHADGQPFVVRAYGVYRGQGRVDHETPPRPVELLGRGRALEYALCYRSGDGDLDDWTRVVRRTVEQLGAALSALQVAEEPNNPDPATGGDGASPRVIEAVVAGVRAAREAIAARGLRAGVGINATPSFNPADRFWSTLAATAGAEWMAALDYVGLDFFPDVFRPLPTPDFRGAVEAVLGHYRATLTAAGVPASVPIRITENGWPTGEGRSEERQAEAIEAVVRAIDGVSERLNVTHYEVFALRDAALASPAGFTGWGLLRADYSPKPAFETYRGLVAELGGVTGT